MQLMDFHLAESTVDDVPFPPSQFYCYWPSSQGQEQHGNVVVEVTEESAEHLYTTRTITLTNAKVVVLSGDTVTTTHNN